MTPSQVEDPKEFGAPFGLEFEWPEELWVWRFPNGDCMREILPEGKFRAVATSIKGITAYALEDCDWTGTVPISSGYPDKYDGPSLTSEGLLLLDDNGVEIARRWLR